MRKETSWFFRTSASQKDGDLFPGRNKNRNINSLGKNTFQTRKELEQMDGHAQTLCFQLDLLAQKVLVPV